MRTAGAGCVSPAQPVLANEHDTAQHPPVIHTRLGAAFRKERSQPLHLLVRQPEQGLIPLSLEQRQAGPIRDHDQLSLGMTKLVARRFALHAIELPGLKLTSYCRPLAIPAAASTNISGG